MRITLLAGFAASLGVTGIPLERRLPTAAVPDQNDRELEDYEARYFEDIREAEKKLLGQPWFADIPVRAEEIPHTLQGKALTDSCFCDYEQVDWEPCTAEQTAAGCDNRTSESYAWGMTRTADFVFWGTVADEQCLETPGDFHTVSGIACADSFADNWKIPSVYMYNVKTDTYRSIAPADMAGTDFDRLNRTVGLRSAGQKGGVVMLAGFGTSLESVYLFSFNAETGDFLCSLEFDSSNDVRKFTQDDSHDLYVGVSRTDGSGDIFRFTGSLQDPCSFGLIANLPGEWNCIMHRC